MTLTAWLAVAVFVVVYVLIATEWVHRVAAALGGGAAMLLIGATGPDHAFFSPESGIDWNVIFLLVGMMLLVSVIRRTGAFEYLATWATKRARGRPMAVMIILVLVTAVASALLDNVTTVLLVAPVTLLVCDRLEVPVAPFLIAEALASNIGGTATLVGDPPNIIIASRAGLSFDAFLRVLTPLVIILLVVFVGLCRLMFGRQLRYRPERAREVMALRERDAIRDVRLLAASGVVLGAVMVAFVAHPVLGLEPSVVALLGGLLLFAVATARPFRIPAADIVRDVEWPTLAFFAGLFVMVGGLVHTGVIGRLAGYATDVTGGRLLLTTMVLIWASAALSALVDNIPYVATMAPVVERLTDTTAGGSNVLWWALAVGADLGGNATAVGASANVVVLGIAERSGRHISFWEFSKYGALVAVVTLAISTLYLWLRFFVLS
ncbi:MAG: ArsB/NhaD family transporter [Actinocatenispora sp.]